MDTYFSGGRVRTALWLTAGAVLLFLLRAQVALALGLIFGGGTTVFFALPLCRRLEKKLGRGAASFLSVAILFLAVAAFLLLLLPPFLRQAAELGKLFPALFERAKALLERINTRLSEWGLTPLRADKLDYSALTGGLTASLGGVVSGAGTVVGGVVSAGLSVMLGMYFMREREKVCLQMELMIPVRLRRIVIRMAAEALRELRGYLRGQALICAIVAALSALGLALIKAPSPLALGLIVGAFNIVPYFGPVLGGIPVVLITLSQGILPALLAVAVLFVVQQLDGMLISPRVMSGVTGLSPAAVLLALTLGGSLAGVLGMLLALPALLIVRICFRVWASRNETIEKREKV